MQQPVVFAGRYRCLEKLGEGRYGVVFRAFDPNLGAEIALKLFTRPGIQLIEAFQDAQLLMALEGKHVLQVLEADSYFDVPYMVTRVAANGTAEAMMGSRGVGGDRALLWVSQLLAGLDHCHANGVIHRDIKPSNLFLETLDHAQLGDFGVASRLRADGTVSAHGDPRIMAPEMWLMGAGDARSDVYSVGVTAYTLLTGRFPCELDDPLTDAKLAALRACVLNQTFPRLRDLAPQVPKGLAEKVDRAMNPNPAVRYQDARSMQDDLARVVLPIVWTPLGDHVDHAECWEGKRPHGSSLRVCVLTHGDGSLVTTRRATTMEPKIRRHCHERVKPGELRKLLRRTFQELARGEGI